jgi:hypothetical protein
MARVFGKTDGGTIDLAKITGFSCLGIGVAIPKPDSGKTSRLVFLARSPLYLKDIRWHNQHPMVGISEAKIVMVC